MTDRIPETTPTGDWCRWCGRTVSFPCMNTRDMEVGEFECFMALQQAGGGERSGAWLALREKEFRRACP